MGKRLVKTPKLYFNDVGLLCFLPGLNERSVDDSYASMCEVGTIVAGNGDDAGMVRPAPAARAVECAASTQ